MGMKIEKSFVVAAPRGEVWAFLTDPYRVADCLPGAAVTDKVDDTTYKGTMTVKVGPVVANYRGTLRFERLDEAAGEAELAASAQETRGKGAADMRMHSRVVERSAAETEVVVTSDVSVVGVLAQFGRGMIDDVSDQLFGRFAAEMRRRLEGPGEAGETAAAAPEAVVAEPEPTGAPATGAPEPAVGGPPVATGRPEPAAAAALGEPPAAARRAESSPSRQDGEDVLDLGAIGGAAAGRAALRALRRPGFWVGVAVLVVILWLVLR
ncbi:MAG TPA: SRPBCC family protein [Thermoanaerobaculia bacterium]